jgi:hypothetical protein
VQDPFTGDVTLIRAAVNDVADEGVPDGAIAVTQSPFLIFATVVATVRLNFVLAEYVTATCPLCWFCTCTVLPLTAAMSPDAAGPPNRVPLPWGACAPLLELVEVGAEGELPAELHAASRTMATASATVTVPMRPG